MTGKLDQLKLLWSRLHSRQRMLIAGGTLGVLVGVGVLAKTMSSPDYKPLMSGLEPGDAQAITQELATKKIDSRLSADGKSIEVEASQLDAARMEIAAEGPIHSGRLGFELFDKTSWGQTDFDEKVNYQRALEGELERTIGTLSNVKSARVHLVLPRNSVFMDRERPAKASVTLKLRRGNLTRDQLDGIARLVSGAVEDLAPDDVAIVDADSNQPLNHGGSMQGRELEDELTKRLIDTIGPVVGIDNLRASVNVEYDLTSSEEDQDRYDPNVSALLTTQKTMEHIGAGAADGGVAGTTSNLPGGPGQTASQDAGVDSPPQTSSSENSTFGVNKVARHTVSPAGRIRRITAAILVNDASEKKAVDGRSAGSTYRRSATELLQIQSLAAAVLGADTQRGDVVTVQDMTFAGVDEQESPLGWSDKVQKQLTAFAVPLRYGSLLLLALLGWALIVRPVQKQLTASFKELKTTEKPALPSPTISQLPEPSQDSFDKLLAPDTSNIGLKKALSEMVQAEPVAMARTLQTWLREG